MASGKGTWLAAVRARLADRLILLAATAAVTLLFVVAGGLGVWFGVAGLALLAGIAALVPTGEPPGVRLGEPPQPPPLADSSLQLFIEALPDPCLLLDRRSVLVHRNEAAVQQFPSLVPGSPIAMSLRAPAVLTAIEAVRRSGTRETVELHQTTPTETWHRVTVAPLHAGEGQGILVVTLQSLTEARRLDAMRSDFIANASHELRTPLASLLGFIDTLLGPAAGDPAAQAKFLEIMRAQARRMSKLIDDLLSLSRIEMHQHLRPTMAVDLHALLREVCAGMQAQADENGVAVHLDLPAAPVTVTGDRDELYEVFENLLDNALKYGAEGGRVEVALTPVTRRAGYAWLVSVTDHGDGIAAEHVPRLTERFYRVDAESSRRKKGTGLGLAIVKHIIARHRGLLSIRSEPGQGTRVEVLLPG